MVTYFAGQAGIAITADFSDFNSALETRLHARDESLPVGVRLKDDALTGAQTELDTEALAKKLTIPVGLRLDTEEADGTLDAWRDTHVDEKLSVGVEFAEGALDGLQAKLDAAAEAQGLHLTVMLRLDTKEADAQLAAWRGSHDVKPITQRVAVDKASVRSAGNDINKAKSDFAKALGGIASGGIISLGSVAIEGIPGAIAGLLSVADAAAKAGQMVGLIPALGFAGLVGAAGVGIGISGLSGVFSDLKSVDKNPARSADRQADELDSVTESQTALSHAQREEVLDQKDLNDTYREATRRLRDMNEELESQRLATEDAGLGVKEAAKHLSEVTHDPMSDSDARERAKIQFEEAIDRAKTQQEKTADLSQDTARANALDVAGSKDVVAAKQKVVDGVDAEVKATVALQKATDALAHGGKYGQLDDQIAKLSPDAQQMVASIRAVIPAWHDMVMATQDSLTGGLGSDITAFSTAQLPNLKDGLVGVDSAINTGLRMTLGDLSTDVSKADFKTSLDNTSQGFANAAAAAAPLTDAVTELVTVGSQFLPALGTDVANLADRFSNFIARTASDGTLANWIKEGETAAKELGQTVEHIGSGIASVGRSAASGGTGLQGLDQWTGKLSTFLKSDQGQDKMKQFFTDARDELEKWKPVLSSVPELLHQISDGMKEWSDVALPFLNLADDLLKDQPALLETIVSSYLQFKMTSPIFSALKAGWTGVSKSIDDATAKAKEAAAVEAGDTVGAKGGGKGGTATTSRTPEAIARLQATANAAKLSLTQAANAQDDLKTSFDRAERAIQTGTSALELQVAVLAKAEGAAVTAETSLDKARLDLAAKTSALAVDVEALAKAEDVATAAEATDGEASIRLMRARQNVATATSTLAGAQERYNKAERDQPAAAARTQLADERNTIAQAELAAAVKTGGATEELGVKSEQAFGKVAKFTAGASGLMALMGGPWGIALMAGGAALDFFMDDMAKAHQRTEDLNTGLQKIKDSQAELADIYMGSQGAVTGPATENLAGQISGTDTDMNIQAQQPTFTQKLFHWDVTGEILPHLQVQLAEDAIKKLGMTDQAIAAAMANDDSWNVVTQKLRGMSAGGALAIQTLDNLRITEERSRTTAQNTSPQFEGLTGAIKTLADTSSTAAEQINAVETALDLITGKPKSAADALEVYNQGIRDASAAAQQLADHSQGTNLLIGSGPGSQVDTSTPNGKALRDTLKEITDNTLAAQQAGNDMTPILAENDAEFKILADAAGVSAQQIKDVAASVGYLPDTITLLLQTKGAGQVQQDLTYVLTQLQSTHNQADIPLTMFADDTALQDTLKNAGLDLQTLNDKGVVHVTVPNQDAITNIQAIVSQLAQVKDKNVNVTVTGNIDQSFLQKLATLEGIGLAPARNSDGTPILTAPASAVPGALNQFGMLVPGPSVIPGREAGGALYGGTPGRDSIALLGEPGEHMLTVDDVKLMGGQDAVYAFRAALHGRMERRQTGGAVGTAPAAATATTPATAAGSSSGLALPLEQYAQSLSGQPYGGDLDCSGFISKLALEATGFDPNSSRMGTATEGTWLEGLGFKDGSGAPGTFQVGWINSASMAAGGHTAGTLPNNVNVESNSAGVQYGGKAIGAANSLFVQHAYLQMGTGAGIIGQGGFVAPTNVTTANTQSVLYPQVALPKVHTDDQLQILQDKAAVDNANSSRNQVYANPASTAQDKAAADYAYEQAQNTLTASTQKSDQSLLSVQGLATKAAGILATGLLGAFVLGDSILSSTNSWNQALNTTATGLGAAGFLGSFGGYGYVPQNIPQLVTTYQSSAPTTTPALANTPPGPAVADDAGASTAGADPTVVAAVRRAAAIDGWGSGPEWDALTQLITHESNWNPLAQNPTSTAKGIFQFIDTTQSQYGAFTQDPYQQAVWGDEYIASKYGDPEKAWNFWQFTAPTMPVGDPPVYGANWYDDGGIASGIGFMAKNVMAPERVLNPRQTSSFESMLPLLEGLNASSGWTSHSSATSSAWGTSDAQPTTSTTHDHSVNIHQPQILDPDSLMNLINRKQALQQAGSIGWSPV